MVKGLFNSQENELQPTEPATRLWVSTLMVRDLRLEQQALAKMNTQLSFVENDSIPAASVGYVADVVEKKILNGYPDNPFQLNKPVTRAEMATQLDRTDQELPYDYKLQKKLKKIELEGVVTDVTTNFISVKNENDNVTTYDVSDKVVVFHAEGRRTVSNISVGDEIKFTNGHAVLIEVEKKAEQIAQRRFEAKGTLMNVNTQSITIKYK